MHSVLPTALSSPRFVFEPSRFEYRGSYAGKTGKMEKKEEYILEGPLGCLMLNGSQGPAARPGSAHRCRPCQPAPPAHAETRGQSRGPPDPSGNARHDALSTCPGPTST